MKKTLLLIVKLSLTVIILAVIIRKLNFDQIYRTFTAPNMSFLFIAFILVIPNFIFKFWKWHYLLQTCGINESYYNASRSYLAGLAIGMVTPARAGEVGRALFLQKKEKLKGTGVVIVDKLFDLTGIVLLSLLGARIFISPSMFYLLFALVVAGIAFLLFSSSFHRLIVPMMSNKPFGTKIKQVLSVFEHLSKRVVTKNIAITLAMFFVVLFQCYFFVKTFYPDALAFNAILFAYPLVIVANILPITIGGLGVREGVAVFTLSIFNIPGEVAVSATLYLFIINVVFPSLIGCMIIAGAGNFSKKAKNIQAAPIE